MERVISFLRETSAPVRVSSELESLQGLESSVEYEFDGRVDGRVFSRLESLAGRVFFRSDLSCAV